MTRFYTLILWIGFSMILLSIIMFLLGIGMFTARGNYPQFFTKLSEVSFILWLPFLVAGVLLTTLGIGIYLKKKST